MYKGVLFGMRGKNVLLVKIPLLPGIDKNKVPITLDDLDYHAWLPCHDKTAGLVTDLDSGQYQYCHPEGFSYIYLYNDQVHLA